MTDRPGRLLTPAALARLANLQLAAREIVEGFLSGLHKSPYHGFSIEFAEYRDYVQGDDLRYLDWKAYGKSDRLYIKKFHSETNTAVRILLDRSASMSFASREQVSKFRWALMLSAALSFVASRQQDAPGVLAFSSEGSPGLPPKGGQGHLTDIFRFLEGIEPAGETTLASTLHAVAESARRRSIVVLLSDLWDDPDQVLSGLRHLRFRGHEVILFHVLDPAELLFPYTELLDFQDLETSERLQVHAFSWRRNYLKELREFAERFRRACSEARIEYHLARTDRPFDLYLAGYLHKRSKGRR